MKVGMCFAFKIGLDHMKKDLKDQGTDIFTASTETFDYLREVIKTYRK